MKMDLPSRMYKMRKIVVTDMNVPATVPNPMYKMKSIYTKGNLEKSSDHVSLPMASRSNCGNITEQSLQHMPEMSTLLDRQEKILLQLEELRQQMISLKVNLTPNNQQLPAEVLRSTFACPLQVDKFPEIIINASPAYPPYSLLLIQKLCKSLFHLHLTSHLHSSVVTHENIKKFSEAFEHATTDPRPTINIRLIWKDVGPNTEVILTQIPVVGEVNILRYFSRLIPNILKYEVLDNYYEIDSILDICHCLIKSTKERAKLIQNLNSKLGKGNWLCGVTNITIADIAAHSALKQIGFTGFSQSMAKWFKNCETVA